MAARETVEPTAGRLLILDDDVQVGETVRRIAQSSGFAACLASEVDEFLEYLDSWDPSHIVLDLRMPGMDGVQVIAELSRRGCEATIIIASGVGERILAAAERSAIEHGLHMGSVLAKPFTASDFRAALTAPVGIARIARQVEDVDPAPAEALAVESLASGIERDLVAVVGANALEIALQPKVDCATLVVDGFEALVRWPHAGRGHIPPSVFVPIATRLGIIDRLTDQVLVRAATWLRGLDVAATGSVMIAVNVPTALVVDGVRVGSTSWPFEDWAESRCESLGVAPERILFEVTETDAMSDSVASLDALTRLRVKGFQLSIDDFGTGYSSLARLARLPFSELKIDRSFVVEARAVDASRSIVRAAIDLAHALGLRTVAEGVEDAATLGLLRSFGCDLAQGYHVGGPMTPDEATSWIAGRATVGPERP